MASAAEARAHTDRRDPRDFALLATRYRRPLDWSASSLPQAKQSLDRLYRTLEQLPGDPAPGEPPAAIQAALEDDLITPKAFAELFALAARANTTTDPAERRTLKADLRAAGTLLGFLGTDPATWFKSGKAALDATEIERLIEARNAARSGRNFAEADRIRERLAAAGVLLEDGPDGTRWRLAG